PLPAISQRKLPLSGIVLVSSALRVVAWLLSLRLTMPTPGAAAVVCAVQMAPPMLTLNLALMRFKIGANVTGRVPMKPPYWTCHGSDSPSTLAVPPLQLPVNAVAFVT